MRVDVFFFTSSQGEQGVVSIASPVNIAFAPAMKHIAYTKKISVTVKYKGV